MAIQDENQSIHKVIYGTLECSIIYDYTDEITIFTHSNLWYTRVLNNLWLYKMKYQSIHIVIYGTLVC